MAAVTVLALTPEPYYFGGSLLTGNTWINLDWENQVTAAQDVTNGAHAIDVALHQYAGPKIVFGHSMAAEAAAKWLRDYGPTSDIDPSPTNVKFVLAAFPETKYTGITQVPTPPSPQPSYGGNGVPSATPYTVTDFHRQYDEFADYPNVTNPNSLAQANALDGFGFAVHIDYFNESLDPSAPGNTSWVEGNITYIISTTSLGDREWQRDEIELGYSRPHALGPLAPVTPAPPTTDLTQPDNLLPALRADPRIASAAAQIAAKPFLVPNNDVTITVYNKIYQPVGEINDHISLDAEWKRNDIGTATIVLKGNDPNIGYIMKATTEVVPIVIQIGQNMRWSGRVNSFALALDSKKETLTVECVDDFTWFSRILVWPNFLLPIEAQFPKNAIFVGPVVSCVLTMVAEQSLRLQSGFWDLVNDPIDNLLAGDADWKYFTEKLQAAGGNIADMLLLPIVVIFPEPLLDASPWVAVQGRMDKIYDLCKDLLMNYGLSLTASLWLPGDPQPPTHINGVPLLPLALPLNAPTILVSCVDRSGVVGPTATMVDGLVKDVVDLQASLLGNILSPFLNPQNKYYPANLGVNIAPLLGVNFVPSWVVFNGDDINSGGAITYKLNGYAPIAHTIIGGGKSPQWLNDLINATMEFAIDAIEMTVGFTGIPDDLLNGTFDDILLAFQEMENVQRRAQMGPYGFPEYFTKTGASAYTVDEWFALMQAMFDTSGYNCVELKWANGYPYTVGQDVFLGSLVSFVRQGQMYTDYVYSIKLKDDRKTRAEVDIIVGNGKREVNPVLRVVKMITGLQEVINTISMST